MRLSELKSGEKGVIVKVLGHGGFRKRIVEMGFIKGKEVEVILNAPLKDPIEYKIMNYQISLRREEANHIEIISEEEAKKLEAANKGQQLGIQEDIPIPEEQMRRLALKERRTINVALVGNPNCGKTSLFNVASNAHEHVGNYSGVTVDAKEGFFEFQGYHFRLIDLPGTYSLSAYSPEELYVRKYIIDQTPDVIINVVDASNIERNMYLTTQLIDMNIRMVVALNMFDELSKSGNELDYTTLSKLIGVPMIPTISKTGMGIEQLFHVIINIYEGGDFIGKDGEINKEVLKDIQEWHRENVLDHGDHLADFTHEHSFGDKRMKHTYRHIHVNHGPELESLIDIVKGAVAQNHEVRSRYSTRFLAIKLLENDKDIEELVSTLPNANQILTLTNKCQQRIRTLSGQDSESAITDAKYGFIQGALAETFTDYHKQSHKHTTQIDQWVTHRIWGYPIFFLLLYLMFEITFILGDYPMQGIEWLVDQFGMLIRRQMADGPLKDMLVDGIVGGVGGVIVFLPNILILYFFISLMEDSGYMARAAFIMDKLMHKMGLHGKSFIPLIMGFGCNVPAVMATRTIENRKSRLVTMLVLPFMSCSARLPLYLILAGAFFPAYGGLVMLFIYAFGILMAILMAQVLSYFLMKGDNTPFVMELPPYRMPTTKSIFRHTWEKGWQYLQKMSGIIMVASIIIWFLGYYPNHSAYHTPQEQQENSYIGRIGKVMEPVIQPLGFDWKMGVGIISGTGAKELVVSSLSVLYSNEEANTDESNRKLQATLRQHITPQAAMAYMIFVLMYFPCIATLVAIKNESRKWKWAIFAACYTTALAWICAWLVYRVGGLLF
ncbi:MAG: ferrous iron transport protein B [Bacteroidaceae bacterium]|nr:ferrous iron transport protein B [Bacteroidaceae bacterium]